ncbi:MAG: hypothetical protein WCI71_07355, partial [Bacteroidota bacterium]
ARVISSTGSETAVIHIPVTRFDYDIVTTGETASWECQVENSGTTNLVIDSIDNLPFYLPYLFRMIILWLMNPLVYL